MWSEKEKVKKPNKYETERKRNTLEKYENKQRDRETGNEKYFFKSIR
jgi:hypothetical protein